MIPLLEKPVEEALWLTVIAPLPLQQQQQQQHFI